MPDHLRNLELFDLVKTYQVHVNSRTCWNATRMNNNLNPAKVNVIHLTKDNFTKLLSIKEILDKLDISKNDCYRVLSISKDKDLELHLKRQPNSCFVNNSFDISLKASLANIDIQTVFSEYKSATYMCQHFSKTEDQCSPTMKQAGKEALENNMYHNNNMKANAKA